MLTLALVVSLCVFNIDASKISSKPGRLFASLMDAVHVQTANADTVLEDNQEQTNRFLYWLINDPPHSGYPSGFDGPEDGLLGMIRQITGPTASGLGLYSNGISSSADIPSTGNVNMTENNGTFTMYFKTPGKTIPT